MVKYVAKILRRVYQSLRFERSYPIFNRFFTTKVVASTLTQHLGGHVAQVFLAIWTCGMRILWY